MKTRPQQIALAMRVEVMTLSRLRRMVIKIQNHLRIKNSFKINLLHHIYLIIRLYLREGKALFMSQIYSLRASSLLIICLLCQTLGFCQNKVTLDSLHNVLKTASVDTIKIEALNELAWELRKIDSKKAKEYAEQAYVLSDSLNMVKMKVTSLSRLGTVAIYLKEYEEAENIYLNLLQIEKNTNHIYGVGRANNQLGRVYKIQGKLVKSIEYRLESLKAFEQIKDSAQIALVANNIGNSYSELNKFDLAIKHLIKSITIDKQMGNINSVNKTLSNLGSLHNEMEDYSKALQYLNKSEENLRKTNDIYWLSKVYVDLGITHMGLENFDMSLDYLNKALEIKTEMGSDNDAGIYNNFGALYAKKGDLNTALTYYQKSISVQPSSTGYNFLDANVNIAEIFYKKKQYNEAIKYYESALKLTDDYQKAAVKLKIYNDLSICYASLKQNDKALKYKNDYVKLDKDIRASQIKAIQFEAAYNEQQKEIELLQTTQELTKTKLENLETENTLKQTQILALSIGLLITLVLFFLIFKAVKLKAKAKLAEKNRLIDLKNVQELLDKQEIRFNQARLDGQEKERSRIAKDLHDRLGSMLSMVKIHYKFVEEQIEKLKTTNKKQYEKANTLLDEACEEVRKIANDINSGVLAKFGLVAALEDLSNTLNENGKLTVEFNTHNFDDRLSSDIEITIYRIIQELVNNILKHANAKEISIQLLQSDKLLNIMVVDDGIGFIYEPLNLKGMGLKNVQSRVESLKGDLYVDSTPNNGTTITIDIPVKEINI